MPRRYLLPYNTSCPFYLNRILFLLNLYIKTYLMGKALTLNRNLIILNNAFTI